MCDNLLRLETRLILSLYQDEKKIPFKTPWINFYGHWMTKAKTTSPKLILFLLLENVSVTLKLLEKSWNIFKDSKL